MRRYATSLILWASLLVNEAHSLFTNAGAVVFHGQQMSAQWFVWLVGNSLWGVLMAGAILLYRENRVNRTTVRAYLLFCLADTAFLFINYKQSGYEAIYTFLLIGWILIYNYGARIKRQGNITAY